MFIICLLALLMHGTPDVKWVIVDGCKLQISGRTNVNKFGCSVTDYDSVDTLTVGGDLSMTGHLQLDIGRFSCANELMTKDLRKTLEAKDYPQLSIRFVSLSKLPCWKWKQETISGTVVIELAGVVKQFHILYTFSKD